MQWFLLTAGTNLSHCTLYADRSHIVLGAEFMALPFSVKIYVRPQKDTLITKYMVLTIYLYKYLKMPPVRSKGHPAANQLESPAGTPTSAPAPTKESSFSNNRLNNLPCTSTVAQLCLVLRQLHIRQITPRRRGSLPIWSARRRVSSRGVIERRRTIRIVGIVRGAWCS